MKKSVSGLLVLLTVAAAAFFFLKVRRFAPERPRATELAPAETILFAHAPNLGETAARFQKTGLFAIWREPEVQEFLEKPRKIAPSMQQWEAQFARLSRVAPREAFVAVTSMEGPQPRFVAGFSFAGNRRDVEALLAEPRAEFKKRWPQGTSASANHRNAAIEIFTYPLGLLAECFVRNWYFVASDVTLLRATLDRYENSASATAGALAGDDVFQKATAPLGARRDLTLYGRTAALGERVSALMPALGQPPKPKAAADAKQIQAIAASTRIDGAQMRDTVFVLSPREATEPPLSRATLALAGAGTFLYFAMGIASLPQIPEPASALVTALPGVAAVERSLAARKLAWSDFGAAFGPEMGTAVEWPDDAAAPALLLATEVRDPAKARECVEAVIDGMPDGAAWSHREEQGASYYAAPVAGLSLANPAIAITPRFALLGFSADAVALGVKRMEAARAGNAENSPLQAAAKQLAEPTSGFGYLDAAALFERAYRTLRPALTMSLAFSGDLGDYIDAGKLPSAQTISRHLTPSVFSQSSTQDGMLMESVGTLTFSQLVLGTMAGAAAAFPSGGKFPAADGRPRGATADGDVLAPTTATSNESGRAVVPAAIEPESVIPAR